jgi:predicted GIY-YIG superfamily endonuclease
MNEVVAEQSKELRLKLDTKDSETEKTFVMNFKNKHVVYLIKVEDNIIKFGRTKNIENRLAEHKNEFGQSIKLVNIFETLYDTEFEDVIKRDQIIKPYIIKKKYKKNQTELIKLCNEFTYNDLIDRLEFLKQTLKEEHVANLLKRIEELEKGNK